MHDYPGEEGNLFEHAVLGIDEMHQNILGFTVEETMNNAKNIIKESKLKKQNSAPKKKEGTEDKTDKRTFGESIGSVYL